jgi:membrane-associated phospholipid phosphatase
VLPIKPATGRRPASALFAAAGAFLLAFAVTCLAFVRTGGGQWLDGALLPRSEVGGGYAQETALYGPAGQILGRFGNPPLLGLLVIGIVGVAVASGRLAAGVAAVALFVCAAGAAGLAKQVIVRPELGVTGSTTHNSFPSGHVAAATALLLGLLLVVPPRARWWVAVPGALGVSVIAASTMVLGWHRFSDVVGAVLLVAALASLAGAALAALDRRRPAERRSTVTVVGAGDGYPPAAATGHPAAATWVAEAGGESSETVPFGPVALPAAAGRNRTGSGAAGSGAASWSGVGLRESPPSRERRPDGAALAETGAGLVALAAGLVLPVLALLAVAPSTGAGLALAIAAANGVTMLTVCAVLLLLGRSATRSR